MANANNADPDLTAPEGAVSDCSYLIRVYTVCRSTKDCKKQLHKKQNPYPKIWTKVFEMLGHLP